jgi:hypothetical protein
MHNECGGPSFSPVLSLPSPALSFLVLPSLPAHPSPTIRSKPLKSSYGSGERCKLPQRGLGAEPQPVITRLHSFINKTFHTKYRNIATDAITNYKKYHYAQSHAAIQVNMTHQRALDIPYNTNGRHSCHQFRSTVNNDN